MKKKCELCNKAARMYCDSDEASLCWDCDYRVHTANFIVSKHMRTLLCHSCQTPTPWTGSGSKLAPTVSVCDACVNTRDNEEDEEEEDRSSRKEEEDDDDDGENQVVPLSTSSSSTTREPASSSRGSATSTLGSYGASTSTQSLSAFSYHQQPTRRR